MLAQEASAPAANASQKPASAVLGNAATDEGARAAIGDAERSAVTFRSYDMAVQLRPADGGLAVLARVTVRNDGAVPLAQIALQISSTLRWDGVSEREGDRTEKLEVSQHLVETDADHTGEANEAVVRLTKPLAPRASAELTLLYSGAIKPSAERVGGGGSSESTSSSSGSGDSPAAGRPVRPGAAGVGSGSTPSGGLSESRLDWDVISPEATSLRGFGDVLWYPTASPQVFLGEGASFLRAKGEQMRRQADASMHLRVSVVYGGEAPAEVFFCGRREMLAATNDDENAPVAEAMGVATAEFATEELGFRTPSLFVTGRPVAGAGGATAVVSNDAAATERVSAASEPVLRLLTEWMGPSVRVLTVVDHAGAPFADGQVLVAPVGTADPAALTPVLVNSLTHARFQSSHVWLDEGVAQLMELLSLERTQGRPAAIAVMGEQTHALALAESAVRPGQAEESLLTTGNAVYYRTKAVAVLWLVRELVGDEVLKQTLQRYLGNPRLDREHTGFERLLEEMSGKSFAWLFEDWVYHDKGLPDLSIVSVEPHEESVTGGQGGGWLVAVQVRNDGGAAADVPLTVRSGTLTSTERIRVSAHSVKATRILFQVRPTEVQVNDGTVPELITSTHVQAIAGTP